MAQQAIVGRASARGLGCLLVAASAVAWSTAGIFTKTVVADVWAVLFWRGLFAALLITCYLGWRGGRPAIAAFARLGGPGWAAATVGAGATVCFIAAFKATAVADVAIVYATAPFVAAGLAWLAMRERPAAATLLAAALSMAGVVVMMAGQGGTPHLAGDLLAVAMTVLMALMMVIMRRWPEAPMVQAVGPVSSLQLVLIGFAMSDPFAISGRDLGLLVGFGVAHAGATVLLAEGVRRIPADEAALLGALEVPLVPLWGLLILAEVPRLPTVIGGGLVIATLAWYLGRQLRPASR